MFMDRIIGVFKLAACRKSPKLPHFGIENALN